MSVHKTIMESKVCPICQNDVNIKAIVKDLAGYSCPQCLHAWRPEPWTQIGPIEHFKRAQYTKIEAMHRTYKSTVKLFTAFEQVASRTAQGNIKKMLDFGCSYGFCMETFKTKGWDVFGIEISPSAQQILDKKKLPWAQSIEASGLKKGIFDCVVMADCIYYLPDPIKILSILKDYLKDYGVLLIRQPTRAGLVQLVGALGGTSKIIQRLWCDHIHIFSRCSTEIALAKAGFENVSIKYDRFFVRGLKGEIVHRVSRAADLITLGKFDLTLSWIVCATKV